MTKRCPNMLRRCGHTSMSAHKYVGTQAHHASLLAVGLRHLEESRSCFRVKLLVERIVFRDFRLAQRFHKHLRETTERERRGGVVIPCCNDLIRHAVVTTFLSAHCQLPGAGDPIGRRMEGVQTTRRQAILSPRSDQHHKVGAAYSL